MPTFIFGTKTLKLFIFMKNWNSRATLKCRLWAIKFGTVSYYGIHNGKMVRANWNFNFWFFWPPLIYTHTYDGIAGVSTCIPSATIKTWMCYPAVKSNDRYWLNLWNSFEELCCAELRVVMSERYTEYLMTWMLYI